MCTIISASLPGTVSYPESDDYASSTTSYWSAFESALKPSCIVKPRDTREVAIIIKWLNRLASISTCQLAIRGGGHTPWAGSANIDGGITIDLSSLKDISVNQDKSIVSIGAGSIWGDVYRRMDELGIAVVGGRGSSVGVGGLTLGGGISYFSARKGFAGDNVVNFEVVLANRKAVNANATSNPDLWRALKGGSNNFRVVTRFDVSAFEHGNFWGGSIIYNDSASPALLQAFVDLNKDHGYDEYAALMQSHAFVTGMGFVAAANIEYTKPTENPETFQAYTNAQPQLGNTMRISNQTDFTDEFVALIPNGRRQLYITTTFKNDLNLVQYAYDTLKSLGSQIPSSPMSTISITIQPITPATTSRAAEKGGNSLSLDDSETALVLCLVAATWDSPADDEKVKSLGKAINDRIHRWGYLNYADQWQDPIGGYGKVNKKKLQEASLKYDPTGFFQKRVSGGFKLFK
ncbi:oxidoreductase FAD-binding protein [Byssothecium circinans]|uniref:Oxidoreductase FAD-binding protein n=1 Tax=Byssothecium circinans TaxID=147558 RepID=A0A6A5UGZ6_9PLEO|nr:oxidoreductase FAD-binding protein [Byssothecium circinans]